MANKEYQLAIKIAGMVEKSLTESCNLTKKQLRGIAKEAADASKSSASFTDAMSNAGTGIDSLWGGATKAVKTTAAALAAAGAAAGAASALALNAGSDFESAFAGVIKTVDATGRQLDELEEGLRDMSKNMPMTAVELAGIAEAAGQLGIATENIEDFTKTMADLSVATNLTSEEAASQFAKYANITGMPQTEFDRLGSSVVALGNNFATTEADIVGMAMRIAGAGTQVGMTDSQIMALSASLSSVGIEAEAGGSAVSTVISNIDKTVATNGKTLKTWAKTVSMTPKEFKEAWEADVAGTLQSVFKGMSDAKTGGENLNIMLDELGISSIRQTDMMKRMSGAADLLSRAVDVSNSAFEENTALAREAEQRYKTFESRVDMVKNRVNDFGISMYQEFKEPLNDVLSMALDATENISLFDPAAIKDMAKGFQDSIPTVVRNLKEAKNAVSEFAQPFIAVGDWMIEHPDVIAGTLAGIGTTIGALKLAQTLTATTMAVKAFSAAMMSNPITMAIGLAALAGGAVVGLSTKVKMANAELKKQRLSEAFGDITLSMGELEETARYILGEETLKQFSVAMEEIGKVSSIADDINASSNTLSKLTWKINMGMELNETDQGTFQTSIDSMIENSISLVEQAQYTARLSVNALFDKDDKTGAELITGFDALYEGINEQVKIRGMQLGAVYKNAMKDGIIDPREAEIIQELQAELARITDQVSQSQLDAKLERIKLQYSGKELDPDTFKNLQVEIQSQLDEAATASYQSYEYDLGALKTRLTRSQEGDIAPGDAAYLTQAMYDELKAALDNQFLKKQMELEMKGIEFQTSTILDAFSDDLGAITPQMGEKLQTAMEESLRYLGSTGNAVNTWSYSQITQWLDIGGLDKHTKAALNDLWKNMEPDFNDMLAAKKQYEAMGKEIPGSIKKGIEDAAMVGMLAGSVEATWAALGGAVSDNPEHQEILRMMQENGTYIPEEIANGIKDNEKVVKTGAESLYSATRNHLSTAFLNPFTIDAEVIMNLKATARTNGNTFQIPEVGARARGGIVTEPELSWIAEGGYSEAVVPLDGSQNAVSIWEEAGERLGVLSQAGTDTAPGPASSGNIQATDESRIIFSPTIYVGSGDAGAVKTATEEAFQQFEQLMERYQKKNRRLAF